MSSLWKKWYKVDELKGEVADLKKQLAAIKAINGTLKKQLETPTKQAYQSMEHRDFLSKVENQK